MLNKVIATLLAAAAVWVPTYAQAQGRWDRGDTRVGGGERRGGVEGQAQGNWQGRGDGGRRDRGDARAPGGFRNDGGVSAAPVQAQAPDGRGFDGQRDWQRRGDARADVPRTDLYRYRAPDRGTAFGNPRLDDRSRIDTRSQIDTRSRFDNRTNYDNRRFTRRPYDNRGYQDRSTFDRGQTGGRWSRDWRRDDRYDWTRYRSSNRNAYHLPRYYAPYGWDGGYRRFSIGLTLSSTLWSQDYWIDDPYSYRLPDAYGPYRWVRYYNDALLIDLRSGQVVDTVYDIFY